MRVRALIKRLRSNESLEFYDRDEIADALEAVLAVPARERLKRGFRRFLGKGDKPGPLSKKDSVAENLEWQKRKKIAKCVARHKNSLRDGQKKRAVYSTNSQHASAIEMAAAELELSESVVKHAWEEFADHFKEAGNLKGAKVKN
jgi:hypothetical protein